MTKFGQSWSTLTLSESITEIGEKGYLPETGIAPVKDAGEHCRAGRRAERGCPAQGQVFVISRRIVLLCFRFTVHVRYAVGCGGLQRRGFVGLRFAGTKTESIDTATEGATDSAGLERGARTTTKEGGEARSADTPGPGPSLGRNSSGWTRSGREGRTDGRTPAYRKLPISKTV